MNSVKEKVCILIFLISFFAGKLSTYAQTDTATYYLALKQEEVSKACEEVLAMTVNGSIPGPTLRLTEGDYAVIYVKNESFHNHISVLWLCHH